MRIDNCLVTNLQQPRTMSYIRWEDIKACLEEVGWKIVAVHSRKTPHTYLMSPATGSWTAIQTSESINTQTPYIHTARPQKKYMPYATSVRILQKSSSHLQLLGVTRVTWSKFHIEDPQILGATVQNLVARATWCPGFVHSSHKLLQVM